MNPALLFLVRRSFANGLRSRLLRLRKPRYLVPTVVGVAYFVLLFGNWGGDGGRAVAGPLEADTALALEWIVAGSTLLLAASAWFLPSRGAPLAFLEAEVALLFPAPVTRKDLVRYKLLDMQKYLLFSAVFIALLAGFRVGPLRGLFVLLGGWLVTNVLTLHGIGAKFTRQSLLDHGASGFRRQALPLALLAAYAGFVIRCAPAFPALDFAGRPGEQVLDWLRALGESPAGTALLPLRLLARPLLAPDLPAFLLGAAGVAAMLVPLYLWVVRSDVAFEEAAAAQAETLARRIEAARKGRFTVAEEGKPARRNPWRLAPHGPPEIAFAWKSVTEILRSFSPRLLVFLVVAIFVALPVAMSAAEGGGTPGKVAAAVSLVLLVGAAFLVLGGPSFLGANLRQDLERVEVLKALPLTGPRLVRCSVAGTVLPVAAIQALLVVAGALLFPPTPKGEVNAAWRLAGAFSLVALLPAFTALSACVEAGGALFFPAWVRPGQPQVQGGMEGMGYGIVTGLGKMLAFGLGGAVPAGLGGAVAAAGIHFGGDLYAPASVMAGSLLAAAILLVEAWAICFVLGRRFERLDPAEEGMIA